MAAFDTPLVMSFASRAFPKEMDTASTSFDDPNATTTAAFSPVRQRSSILVYQKSSLLMATPPQITRALACSYAFLLPLNTLLGLMTWTSGDPWESFLLVVTFWSIALYGDLVIRYAAPSLVTVVLIIGVYSRRYPSFLSGFYLAEKHLKISKNSEPQITNSKHQKTLDEIIETLKLFTSRCHMLLNPFLEFIDTISYHLTNPINSNQSLKALIIRILFINFIWVILSLSSIQIITTKSTVLFTGTIFLTWHSRSSRATRAILWRSSIIRRVCSAFTGLKFTHPKLSLKSDDCNKSKSSLEESSLIKDPIPSFRLSGIQQFSDTPGVRFTFVLYENQRRWVGLGWTTNLFAYERDAWTDEQLNPMCSKEKFKLPDTEDKSMVWKWVDGSAWLIEGAREEDGKKQNLGDCDDSKMGWIYYDSKWQQGRRDIDGWGCYTRRRKWYRDAELVEIR